MGLVPYGRGWKSTSTWRAGSEFDGVGVVAFRARPLYRRAAITHNGELLRESVLFHLVVNNMFFIYLRQQTRPMVAASRTIHSVPPHKASSYIRRRARAGTFSANQIRASGNTSQSSHVSHHSGRVDRQGKRQGGVRVESDTRKLALGARNVRPQQPLVPKRDKKREQQRDIQQPSDTSRRVHSRITHSGRREKEHRRHGRRHAAGFDQTR